MSQPENNVPDGLAVRLIDVRAARINAVAWGKDGQAPDWAVTPEDEDNGSLKLVGVGDKLMIQLTAALTARRIAIQIGLQGLYEVDLNSPALRPASDKDGSVFDRIPEEYRPYLAALGTQDLHPYLRQAFHAISIQMDPTARIMMTPQGGWDILTVEPGEDANRLF